jgi:PIN like domain
MPPDQLDAAIKEARRRIDHKIPPGYADKGKSDPSGDYLVWRQLLDEARVRRLPVVLVTDDQKEDWVRREHGLALGPRPEMYQEMAEATGAHFCLMSTATFLRHAKDYLSVSVSPETVDQAQELPGALVVRERARDEEILQLQIIEMEAEISSFTEQLQRLRQEAYDAQMNVRALQRLNVTNSSGEPLDEEKLKELGDALTQGQAVKVRLDSQIYDMVSGLRALETRRKNLRAKIRAMSEEITTES